MKRNFSTSFFFICIFYFGLCLLLRATPGQNDGNETKDESPGRTPEVIVYDEDAYQRIRNRGDIVDFRGVNLIGADLEGLDLRNVILIDAKLNGARLAGADLRYATLDNADLTKALLCGANLEFTQFDASVLISADFKDCRYLIRTKFRGANLSNAILSGSIINRVTFVNANLSSAQIEDADITDSDFTKSILKKASFWKSKIKTTRFVDIKNAIEANLICTEITDCIIKKVDFSNSIFCDTTITRINGPMDFNECNMSSADFNNAHLSRVLFYNSN